MQRGDPFPCAMDSSWLEEEDKEDKEEHEVVEEEDKEVHEADEEDDEEDDEEEGEEEEEEEEDKEENSQAKFCTQDNGQMKKDSEWAFFFCGEWKEDEV